MTLDTARPPLFTLCIPTKDRSEFLERLLRYYAATGYRHQIFIGDSSEQAGHRARNQRTVAQLSGSLQLSYRQAPGCSSCACLEELSRALTSPYCAFVADDDFLCTGGIERCVAFLEAHPEYGAAHGKGLMLQTEGGKPYGPVGNVGAYPQTILQAETGAARLKEFFTVRLAALLYSVHRTATWRAMFQGVSALPGVSNRNIFKDELIPTCVSVVRGKVAEVDSLYLIRQAHEAIYRHPHAYEWLTSPEWSSSCQLFQARLVDELMQQDHLDLAQARAALKEGFWPYLVRVVREAWSREGTAPKRAPSPLRQAARRVPGLRQSWRAVREMAQGHRDPWSLPALIRPSSPYHADFMPVYQVITAPPKAPAAEESADGLERREPVTLSTHG